MKTKLLKLSSMCLSLSLASQCTLAFTLHNTSSFYLHGKENGNGCPRLVCPYGSDSKTCPSTVTVTDPWCGYIACATKNYTDQDGCLEQDSYKKELAQGGYATWFSITAGSNTCSVPPGNTYTCQYDSQSGNFSLDYLEVLQKYSAGPKTGQDVKLPEIKKYSTGLMYRGVNVSGLEYDGTFLDALYQHPDIPDILYFVEQGMNTVRLAIRWEFLVVDNKNNLVESHNPSSTTLNTMYLKAVLDTLKKYLSSHVNVILDLHNYMRFCPTGASTGQANEPTDPVNNECTLVSKEQFVGVWKLLANNTELAALAKQYPDQLMFGLMNEANSMDEAPGQQLKTTDLFSAEVEAVKEIRKNNLKNYIILSGNYWDPLHGWVNDSPSADLPNGAVFTAKNLNAAGVTDLSRIIMEMHQYFDYNYSGTHEECNAYTSYDDFKAKLRIKEGTQDDLGQWMKQNNMKVLLSEFGAADNTVCKKDLGYMMQFITDHAYDSAHPEQGGFVGWTAWRNNRHGGNVGFSPFNYLQQENYTVYNAQGSIYNSEPGTGIIQGPGNGLMSSVFAGYLK